MRQRPADRVRSLDRFLDFVAEFPELAQEMGIPATLRIFSYDGWLLPHLEQFIDVVAECPVEILEELVELKRTSNWTPVHEFMRQQRAREREEAREEYMAEVLGDDEPTPTEEHVAA